LRDQLDGFKPSIQHTSGTSYQKGMTMTLNRLFNKAKLLLVLGLLGLLLAACSSTPAPLIESQAVSQDCNRAVSGDRAGLFGTTHRMAHDGTVSTYFYSSHDNWQFTQIDFGCTVTLYQMRRYMTRDGRSTLFNRGVNSGEGFAYSVDGVTWIRLTGSTTVGWESYINYAPHAWHSVSYGWSNWLTLRQPVSARFVRFNWDANFDALNEIEVRFNVPSAEIISRLAALTKCADVAGGSTQDGTPINLFGCHGGLNQRWMITSTGVIRSRLGNLDKCLDVRGGATQDGTPVQLFTCRGGANQQWTLMPSGSIRSLQSGKCLDIPSANTQDGTRLQIFTCHGGANQSWLIRRR
jgi:Ricin-type beta-trefoil lectin domain